VSQSLPAASPQGGYRKPRVTDVLLVRLLLLPYSLLRFSAFHLRWLWLFTVLGRELGPTERLHLTRHSLRLSVEEFRSMSDEQRERLVQLALWEKRNMEEFRRQQQEEERVRLAQDSRWKRFRRSQRSDGAGRMTFSDD
ncbi:dnaJ homolog subfamily C member 25-like, partial [Petromyzon marinus]|uniref:dnaJ homolog subfamily C member 25-like n=1 Tax=Petromyzon marinus TaxID=7757 RepID=UPI003F6F0EA8